MLGIPELAADKRFSTNVARVAHRHELATELNAALAKDTADAWFKALTARRAPCGPLNDIADAVALAESLGLEPKVAINDPRRDAPVWQIANPIRLSATPTTYRTAPPRLNEDADTYAG